MLMCCHGDDDDVKDPYEHKMDWSQWTTVLHYPEPEPERPAKKEWRKPRPPNYIPTTARAYRIKEMIYNDAEINVDELMAALGETSPSARLGIAYIAAEHRHTLRFLASKGATDLYLGKVSKRIRRV
jgi:hypothetical protein